MKRKKAKHYSFNNFCSHQTCEHVDEIDHSSPWGGVKRKIHYPVWPLPPNMPTSTILDFYGKIAKLEKLSQNTYFKLEFGNIYQK